MKRQTTLATLGMLLVTVMWGYGFIATKYAMVAYTANNVMLYRFLIASAILLAFSKGRLSGISKRDVFNGAALGFFMYMGSVLQTIAINHTTVAKNAFLTTLNVIMVPLIAAAVQKERIDKFSAIGCMLAITGTGILSLNLDLSINLGDILSITCAFFFSMHIFCQSLYVYQTNTYVLVMFQMLFASLFSLIPSMIMGDVLIMDIDLRGVLGIVYLGVFSTCVCLFMQAVCQKYVPPVRAVIIFSMEAVFASIFAVIVFSEAVTARFLIGSSTILIAVIVSTTKLSFLHKERAPECD